MKGPLFLTVLVIFMFFEANAQLIKRLGAAANYGYIIAHSKELPPISQTYPYGLSGSFQLMNTGKENWEVCNCFYYLGIMVSYDNFNNPEVLGAAYSLAGTFEPLLWQKEAWTFSLLSGIGLSYLSRIYHLETNPSNVFFSVPVNFLIFLTPRLEYRFSSGWSGLLSLSYNHISNGGQSQPNKGMNYPMLGIGIQHYLSSGTLPTYASTLPSPSWEFYADASYSSRKAEWALERRPVFTFGAGAFRTLSSINALGAGVELTQDYSFDVKTSRWESWMPAPFVSHHFLFGRIEFGQKMAYYLNKPAGYQTASFYQRYMLQFRTWSKLWMGMGLKAHGHVAENIDFRLSWRF